MERAPTTMPYPDAASPLSSPPAPLTLRCLDLTHCADCALCSPPPPLEEEKAFQVRARLNSPPSGDTPLTPPQLKTADLERNGEKELRALLAATAEWRTKELRESLAASLDVEIPELSSLLRTRDLARLRKAYALQLCRSWGYKSDLWQRRGGPVQRKRAAPASAAPVEAAPARPARTASTALQLAGGGEKRARAPGPAPPPFAPHLDALQHLLGSYFKPTARRAAEFVAGLRAEAAYRRSETERSLVAGSVDVKGCVLDTVKMDHVLRMMRAGTQAQHAHVRALLLTPCGSDGDVDDPCHHSALRIPLYEGPVDIALRSLHTMFRAGEADMYRPGAVWQAWRVEFEGFLYESFAMLAHAHACYAPYCVSSDNDHVRASDLLLGMLVEFLDGLAEALKYRQSWLEICFPNPPLDLAQLAEAESDLGPRMPFLTREAACNVILQPIREGKGAVEPARGGAALIPPQPVPLDDIEFDSMEACEWLLSGDGGAERKASPAPSWAAGMGSML